jgi:3-oxoacyl-[acyl-carrier protein] reductase
MIHHSASDAEGTSASKEARGLGVEALIVKADQSVPDELARMFEAIGGHYGWLDVLVNSATTFKRKPLLEIDYAEWQPAIGINLTGPFLCTQHAVRLMIAGGGGGAIINISDNNGLSPWAARPHHSVSKAGVIMLTQVAALVLAEHKVRVNCVLPGPVLQPAGELEDAVDQIVKGLPLKHMGNPQDVARAASFWRPTTSPPARSCASTAARG